MRCRGFALVSAFVALLAASVPAMASHAHVEASVGDVVHVEADGHASPEAVLAAAKRLLQRVPTPLVPAPVANGAVEVRAALVQPIIRGAPDTAALAWVAAAGPERWMGALWVETELGAGSPQLVDLDIDGTIVFADVDARVPLDGLTITYHLLGVDGTHTRRVAGYAPILDAAPVMGHAEFGGAVASARAAGPDLLLATPWNLVGEAAPIGMSLYADDTIVHEVVVPPCAPTDDAPQVEPACRQLYVMILTPSVTSISVWHLADGERVEGRSISRASLTAGWTLVES